MRHHQTDQHTHCVEVLEGEDRERGVERIFREIMAENFPNLMKDININIQEIRQTLSKNNSTPRHIKIKPAKDKDKDNENLESSKRNVSHHMQGILNKIISRNFGGQKATVKQESCIWPNFFKSDREIKTFPHRQ